MIGALYVGKTGVDAGFKTLTNISNNLANANTIGFKKGRVENQDLAYQDIVQPGSQVTEDAQAPSGLMLGTGVKTVAIRKVFSDGSQVQTDNDLDVAINGRGFLKVLVPGNNEMAYTRAGQLQVSAEGQLVTSDGYQLQPPITVPAGTVKIIIGSDGAVSAISNGASEPAEIGRIELSDFINPAGLLPMGGNLFKETAASGAPQDGQPGTNGLGRISQGSLESSNVNIAEELINMITTQRIYEVNSKAISTADEMLQFTNQQV